MVRSARACLPCALGAAIACPDRKVVALQSDGSALYTLQSLWSMAREGTDVCVVIAANQRYQMLKTELDRLEGKPIPARASDLTELRRPEIRWVDLARGLGVDAVRVDDVAGMRKALQRGIGEKGPFLIEALLP